MRRIVVGLLAAVTLAGCGASGPQRTFPGGGIAETVSADCVDQLGPLRDALIEIDARLDIGLTMIDYRNRVGDARVAYSRIEPDALDGPCLQAGRRLESALNEYMEAQDKWAECIEDTDCSTDTVQPDLQVHWSAATRSLDEVRIVWRT